MRLKGVKGVWMSEALMNITDTVTLADGRKVHIISSDAVPAIHVGDTLIDCHGNRFMITGVGGSAKCFGVQYTFSLILDGEAERGRIRILPNHLTLINEKNTRGPVKIAFS